MGHLVPVVSGTSHLIHCYIHSLETCTSTWTICLLICQIVARIQEGFPPGPGLTDRDAAFQPSHYEHVSSLLPAGHHSPDPHCRNSLALFWGEKEGFESKHSYYPFCSDASLSCGQVKLHQNLEGENSCRASPSCRSRSLGGSGISSPVCRRAVESLSTT